MARFEGAVAVLGDSWRVPEGSRSGARLAAWFGGFAVGSAFVVISSYVDDLLPMLLLLFAGLAWLSVWYRHFGSLLGAVVAAVVWQPLLIAHAQPIHADILVISFPHTALVAVAGFFMPVFAHAASFLFRRHPEPPHEVRGAIAFGLAFVLLVAQGALVNPQASSSFELRLPEGWTTYHPSAEDLGGFPEMYGLDFSAYKGTTPEAGAYRPSTTMVGTTVYAADADSQGKAVCDVALSFQYAYNKDWVAPTTPLAGAVLRGWKDDEANAFYVLDVPRTRTVALAVQRLCYQTVVSVPGSSSIDESELDAILLAFRFR